MAAKHGQSLPHLLPGEVTLLGYAADDPGDTVTLADKEALVLQLAHQIQDQQLEKALLEQGTIYTLEQIFVSNSLYSFPSSCSISDPPQSQKHVPARMQKNKLRSRSASSSRHELHTPSGRKPFVQSS